MAPVEKNKEYTVEIIDMSSEGHGIAKIDGYTIFIPQTVVGDVVNALIVKVKTSFGYGKAVEVVSPSQYRTEPICETFSKCGGCQLMHMDYNAQLNWKQSVVQNNLERISGFTDLDIEPIVGMDKPYEYRNKMIFPVGISDNDVVCGFYASRSHRVIPLKKCYVGIPITEKILEVVTNYMKRCDVTPYDEEKHSGCIRRVFIRNGYKSGQVMVVLSANSNTVPCSDELVQMIREIDESIVSIIWNVNTQKTNLVLGDENITLWGLDFIEDTLCGLTYEISPHSFFQINPIQTESLYEKVISFAGLTGSERVMDIYCGIGTITLACATHCGHATGIEVVEQAVIDARKNAVRNNIDNVEFFSDSADVVVPKLIKSGETPDVVVLDPPRKGSDEVTLGAIVSANPRTIVYVSCDSATLARDLKFLSEHGYKVDRVAPFDMFPNTVHVETVVKMTRCANLYKE